MKNGRRWWQWNFRIGDVAGLFVVASVVVIVILKEKHSENSNDYSQNHNFPAI
jgi:hypothetical protein